jgi:hypothetical protein
MYMRLYVILMPFALAVGIPYFLLHKLLDAPAWINVSAGLAIYVLSNKFFNR